VPRAQLESAFARAPAHPVADALHAAGESSVPLHDVAAVHYALHPDSGFFTVGDRGRDGTARLAAVREKAAECLSTLIALATSKPTVPAGREGRG